MKVEFKVLYTPNEIEPGKMEITGLPFIDGKVKPSQEVSIRVPTEEFVGENADIDKIKEKLRKEWDDKWG